MGFVRFFDAGSADADQVLLRYRDAYIMNHGRLLISWPGGCKLRTTAQQPRSRTGFSLSTRTPWIVTWRICLT